MNLDEIPSRPVSIYVGFEEICKNNGARYEGKLGRDDPYFYSSDPGNDISEEEGDPVDDDEVVDPPPRTSSSKIYFDKTAKKVFFQLYMNFLNYVEFRQALQTYSIQKGVNLKLKPNEKERLYDYIERLRTTNPSTTVSIRTSKNLISGKKVYIDIYGYRRIIDLDGAFLKGVCKGARFKTIITILKEIRCKVMEMMNQMRESLERWISDVSPMAMEVLAENGEYAVKCEVRFNGDFDFEKKNFIGSYSSQLSMQPNTSTSVVAERPTNASVGVDMPANATSSKRRPANAASFGGVRHATASTTDIRPAAVVMPATTSAVSDNATQSTTQQSTSSVGSQKRKTSTALRGGTNPAHKRLKQKKAKIGGFGVLFKPSGSVMQRSENTDRVLHSPTLISSIPTNIDLRFKSNGLRWKGGAAITQRQLQEQSSKRSKEKSSTTAQVTSSTQASKNQSTPSTQDT
ncbi:hypothetical protein FXO38_17373 [Capsicum annuum]|uniref:Uncharacterized protein n=1 Tax=Capsicum annuum TaxID=4072 RepID=A0A2G2YR65_CAPAN|nr:hypothetical protein FXO38_17373 [Capsicum annuum]KAF3650190.1 hypothetical protein FXO37_18591 [Capsicum annuum]PHT72229.1 hypothetical protein T459_23014 [Capsicum annuum]